MLEISKKLLLKLGLKKIAQHIPPRFCREYRKDVIKNGIRVYFSYLKSESKKYSVHLEELHCSCGGKIKKNSIPNKNKKGKREEYWCDCEDKKININEKDIKNEILRNIRNRYTEELEYLM